MAIKLYTKEFSGQLQDIFEKKTYFMPAFGGALQVKDGVKDSENFLHLKTSDTDVVIQNYSTDANVGFGTGTGKSTRFGDRKEIKSVDTQVPYEKPLAIHEGLDDFTVNDIPTQVVAERLALHGVAWAENVDKLFAKALSEGASETLTGELTEAGVTKLFADAHAKFVNNRVSTSVRHVAYVNTEVYNFLVDNKLTTSAKQSSANIDAQTLRMFKGFALEEVADDMFETGEQALFVADGVGVAGVGIQIARTLDSEDFAGVSIQGAGKYGKFIPEKNKKAILKAKLTEATEEGK